MRSSPLRRGERCGGDNRGVDLCCDLQVLLLFVDVQASRRVAVLATDRQLTEGRVLVKIVRTVYHRRTPRVAVHARTHHRTRKTEWIVLVTRPSQKDSFPRSEVAHKLDNFFCPAKACRENERTGAAHVFHSRRPQSENLSVQLLAQFMFGAITLTSCFTTKTFYDLNRLRSIQT